MSSVGEDVPPDRGRNSLEEDVNDSSKGSQINEKTALKRHAELGFSSQTKKAASIPPVAASTQHTYTRPGYESNSNFIYSELSSGPFITHVIRTNSDESSSSNHMRALKIAQLIYNSKISGIEEIKNIGRNKVSVTFKNFKDANSFVSNPILLTHNLSASIPRFHITRMGVITQIPLEWCLEELVNSIECRSNNSVVIKARRLNKKKRVDGNTIWEPTGSVVLTLLGQVLPEHVYCFNMSLPVKMYTLPTIQCHKCCRYGHVRDQCRSAPRCSRCSGPHDSLFCMAPDENISCLYCSGNHLATDMKCPEYSRQKSIKLVMSQESISYTEAARSFPRVRKPFAEAAAVAYPSKPVFVNRSSPNYISSPSPSPAFVSPTSPQTPSVSYKKTISIARRTKPQLGKSYDRHAHSNIISHPSSTLSNGCALNNQHSNNTLSNDELITLLTSTLENVLSKFGSTLPYNVSDMVQSIVSSLINPFLNNGQNHSAMELSEH